jgi:hypothetical protein
MVIACYCATEAVHSSDGTKKPYGQGAALGRASVSSVMIGVLACETTTPQSQLSSCI